MIKKTHKGIPFYEFEQLQDFRGTLRHAVFTKHTDIKNSEIVKKTLGTEDEPVFFSKQLHGAKTHVIKINRNKNLEGDVLITAAKNIPLVIRIADCASVFLFDPDKKAIANIHAGWRGIAKRVIGTAIEKMRSVFGSKSESIFACISPMIGPCCCVFSNPFQELPKFMHEYIAEENMVNLWAAAENHLRECGIKESKIENPRICTACNPEDFFSLRRSKKEQERFGTAIMLL